MRVREGDKVCLKCGGINGHIDGCSADNDLVLEVVSTYSRAQAIEDGVLVDCSEAPFDELNRAAGIKVHVAMTIEAFDAYVYPVGVIRSPIKPVPRGSQWELSPESEKLPPGQSMVGRYWDIVWMLRFAMRGKENASCVAFELHVVPHRGGRAEIAKLKCVAGPADDGDLCLTIMLPDQD
jgi:hypothetical protein